MDLRIGAPASAWALAALLACALLALTAALGGAPARRAQAQGRTLTALPATLLAPASAAAGDASPQYLIGEQDGEPAAANPAQRLGARFAPDGVSVRSRSTDVRLRVAALGFGAGLAALAPAQPHAQANRVSYAHPGLREWYANGPLGLEQGFTVARPRGTREPRTLTIAIALSGNARAALGADGSVTLAAAGGPALRYGELLASDAHGRRLAARLALRGGRLLLRVDASGASWPLTIDPLIQQGAKLPGPASGGFGHSVALSADGDTALVGATRGAWVFTRSGSGWTQDGPELLPSDAVGNAEFGASVALSSDGGTALVGGPGDEGGAGAAWVFTRSGSGWTQQAKLTGAGETGAGTFGQAVALSGDGETALVGAPTDDEGYGAAWVFSRSGSTWTAQSGKLIGSGIVGIPYFGKSVALSYDGSTALIGAPVDRDMGAAWVFTRSGSTWSQQGGKLTAGGEIGKGWFGWSVALSSDGDTAMIGALADDTQLGAAWVFTRSGTTWTQQGAKITAPGERGEDYFGQSVALSSDGNTALIGTYGEDAGNGAAWVYTRSDAAWSETVRLTGSGESGDGLDGNTGGAFGFSVALSADAGTALVAGPGDDARSGAVWTFAEEAPGPAAPAQYGRCLSVPRARDGVTGTYARASCDAPGGNHRHEWYAGVARNRFTIAAGGAATLQSVSGERVACTGQGGGGELAGSGLTTPVMVLRLTGCRLQGRACASAGAGEGEIVTSELEGQLGILQAGVGSAANRIGLELRPAGAAGFMEFSCGAETVAVRGGVISPLRANVMRASEQLRFAAAKGRQRPEAFAEGPPAILEASFGSGPFEALGLRLAASESYEEAVELNSTL